ncbi:MAG: nucleotidyltransferase domain-containing protein [Defluviitaleaceae bacterium]|nr:nucleotidyltransferase domain-containing protein [Defluviitaleaceae bacterium]
MILTIDDIKRKVKPIAEKYNLHAVYVFGSYARNEARNDSDVDILVDLHGSSVEGWIIGGLYEDLREGLDKEVNFVDLDTLTENIAKGRRPWFVETVMKERVAVYEQT